MVIFLVDTPIKKKKNYQGFFALSETGSDGFGQIRIWVNL